MIQYAVGSVAGTILERLALLLVVSSSNEELRERMYNSQLRLRSTFLRH